MPLPVRLFISTYIFTNWLFPLLLLLAINAAIKCESKAFVSFFSFRSLIDIVNILTNWSVPGE